MNHPLPSLTRGSTAAFWALTFAAALFTTHPAAAARVDVKFRLVAFDSDVSGASIDSNNKPVPIEAHPDQRSPIYSYSGDSAMVIYRPGPAGKDGKPTKVTIATIDLSKAPSVPLILLISDPSSPGNYTGFVMDDNYSEFPYGSVKFFNFTQEDDVVGMDGQTQTVKPGQSYVSKNKPKQGSFYEAKVVRVGVQDGATVIQDNWEYRSDYRRLVFIVPQPNSTPPVSAKWVDEENIPPPKPGSTSPTTPGGRTNQPAAGGQQQPRTNNNAGG